MYGEGWELLRELILPGDGFMGNVTSCCIMILRRDPKIPQYKRPEDRK